MELSGGKDWPRRLSLAGGSVAQVFSTLAHQGSDQAGIQAASQYIYIIYFFIGFLGVESVYNWISWFIKKELRPAISKKYEHLVLNKLIL